MNIPTSVILVILAVAGVVLCERCYTDGDCNHVGCDSSTHLACSHRECTCIYGGNSCNERNCTSRADCQTSTCHCSNGGVWHCYDMRCACGRSPIGK